MALLKPYFLEISAVRITRLNFKELKMIDLGDGVLECGIDDCEGDWFVEGTNGYELMPGNTVLTQKQTQKGAKKNEYPHHASKY